MARTGQGIEQFDLDSLTDEQLHELKAQVAAKIDGRVQSRLAEFRRQARDAGYELSLVKIGEELRRRARPRAEQSARLIRTPVAPKYRNPDNPSQIWSGRGHQPRWMQELLAEGRQLAELAIAKPGNV